MRNVCTTVKDRGKIRPFAPSTCFVNLSRKMRRNDTVGQGMLRNDSFVTFVILSMMWRKARNATMRIVQELSAWFSLNKFTMVFTDMQESVQYQVDNGKARPILVTS